jgi:hypothetical protein
VYKPELLTWKQICLLVLAAVLLFGVAAPLVGWLEALGAVLTTLAGLMLAVALAETWIHNRQQQIQTEQRERLQRSVGRDLLTVAGFPVEVLATVLPGFYERTAPETVSAATLLPLIPEIRHHLGEAETQALAAHEGSLDPRVSDEELERYGLPDRTRMRWCAVNIADHLDLYVYDVPARLLAAGVDRALDQAVRDLSLRVRRDWRDLAGQSDPYPHVSTFLQRVKETLDLCETALQRIVDAPTLTYASSSIPERRVGDPVFTDWDRVKSHARRL